MRYLLIALLLLANDSHAFSFGRSKEPTPSPSPTSGSVTTPTPSSTPAPSPSSSPDPATKKLHVTFTNLDGYSGDNLVGVKNAEILLDKVIDSECLSEFNDQRGLIWTNGRTSREVTKHVRSKYGSVDVIMYYEDNGVVGFREIGEIHTNRKFAAGTNDCDRMSNLGHEWLHELEYDHGFWPSRSRPYTVPYSFNAAVAPGACCVCKSKHDCYIKEHLNEASKSKANASRGKKPEALQNFKGAVTISGSSLVGSSAVEHL